MIDALSDQLDAIVSRRAAIDETCRAIADVLARSLSDFDSLPDGVKKPDPSGYRRQLLHEAADGSFSIGCFVWAPGQRTPIHDHAGWGVIGVAEGSLAETSYRLGRGGMVTELGNRTLAKGNCVWCLPGEGNIHRVGNDRAETALSLHVYGARFAEVCRTLYSPVTP